MLEPLLCCPHIFFYRAFCWHNVRLDLTPSDKRCSQHGHRYDFTEKHDKADPSTGETVTQSRQLPPEPEMQLGVRHIGDLGTSRETKCGQISQRLLQCYNS